MTDGDGQKQKKCVHTSNIGECGVQTRKRKTKCDPITKMINEKKEKVRKAKQKRAEGDQLQRDKVYMRNVVYTEVISDSDGKN